MKKVLKLPFPCRTIWHLCCSEISPWPIVIQAGTISTWHYFTSETFIRSTEPEDLLPGTPARTICPSNPPQLASQLDTLEGENWLVGASVLCLPSSRKAENLSPLPLTIISNNRGSGGNDTPLLTHFQPTIQFGLPLTTDLTIGCWLIQAVIWLCWLRAFFYFFYFSRLIFWRQETRQFGIWQKRLGGYVEQNLE